MIGILKIMGRCLKRYSPSIVAVLCLGALSAAAASSAPHSSSGLYIVNPDGGKPKKVVNACIESFSWSPDGHSLAYVRLIKDDKPDSVAEILNLDTGRIKKLALNGRSEAPSWSPDGKFVALGADTASIYVGPTTGAKRAKSINGSSSDYWPAWSPDGRQIAVVGFNGRVRLMRPTGAPMKTLTRTRTGLDVPVRWFPNGKKLLYATTRSGLATINVDGTSPGSIVASGVGRGFAISPDGRSVAYDTDKGVYIKSSSGGGAKSRPLVSAVIGGWSPDGTQLVVIADGVYVINADGSGQRKIGPRASADGFWIGQPMAEWSSRRQIAYMDTAGDCGGPS